MLSNPQLRTAYDEYGEEGLNTKWEVGHRVKTPQELREEYSRLAREKREMELESLVRNKNDITINVDATRVFKSQEIMSPFGGTAFARKSNGSILDPLKRAEIMQLYMKNSFEVRSPRYIPFVMCMKTSRLTPSDQLLHLLPVLYCQTQFGPRTQFIVGGQMTSRSGMGGGNVVGTIRHAFSEKLNVEVL